MNLQRMMKSQICKIKKTKVIRKKEKCVSKFVRKYKNKHIFKPHCKTLQVKI